jgi:hypothetical protein
VFAASRLFFLAVGALASAFLPGAEPIGEVIEPPGFLSYWGHWDGAWYGRISTDGYGFLSPSGAPTAFFPMLPILMRAGTALGGGAVPWGVFVSLVATLPAMYFLYRIAEDWKGEEVARASTLSFAFFPTAFFLNAPYTEALFVLFTTACVWAARVRRDLLLAGALGAFASATRNLGVLLLVPLVYEWLRHRREFGVRGLFETALVPAGLVGYTLFLWGRFGDPFVSARQQGAYWGRELTNPAATLDRAWSAGISGLRYVLEPASLFLDRSPAPSLSASNTLNLAFLVLFLVLMGIGFVVLPPGLSLFAFAAVVIPILTPTPQFPLMSLPRFLLAAFPLFLVLGYLLSRSKPALYAWLACSGLLGAALAAMFVTWRWVA